MSPPLSLSMLDKQLLYCHREYMSTTKEERLQIRVGPAEKTLLERAAAASHLNMSAFVVQAAASKAEEVLAERSSIRTLSSGFGRVHRGARNGRRRLTTASPRPCAASASSAGLTEVRRPALLDARRHEREQFDSGEPMLDEWLRRYAGQNRRRDTAATWVIADASDVVVAYASIAMTGIDRPAAPEVLAKGSPDPVPALLLGRLAVDHRYSRLGIGTDAGRPRARHRRRAQREGGMPSRRRDRAHRQSSRPGGNDSASTRSTQSSPTSSTSTSSPPRSTRHSGACNRSRAPGVRANQKRAAGALTRSA